MRTARLFGFVGLAGLLSACGGMSEEAEAYLTEAIGLMRARALTRAQVDWDEVDDEIDRLASDAQTISDTYPAISRALTLLGTNHSLLLSPTGEVITYPSTAVCQQDVNFVLPSEEGIGYVRVRGFTPDSDSDSAGFARRIQERIAGQDSEDIDSWIVDLRDNTGGNMWPMIAGLGPFFDSTLLGHFVDASGDATPWGYRNGRSTLDGQTMVQVTRAHRLLNPAPRIAVLSSQRVASSGEATLLAFKKQSNVRIFGSNSCGLSTANSGYTLRDGSTLLLTTAITADREQEGDGGPVQVDDETSPGTTLRAAIQWLQEPRD